MNFITKNIQIKTTVKRFTDNIMENLIQKAVKISGKEECYMSELLSKFGRIG